MGLNFHKGLLFAGDHGNEASESKTLRTGNSASLSAGACVQTVLVSESLRSACAQGTGCQRQKEGSHCRFRVQAGQG